RRGPLPRHRPARPRREARPLRSSGRPRVLDRRPARAPDRVPGQRGGALRGRPPGRRRVPLAGAAGSPPRPGRPLAAARSQALSSLRRPRRRPLLRDENAPGPASALSSAPSVRQGRPRGAAATVKETDAMPGMLRSRLTSTFVAALAVLTVLSATPAALAADLLPAPSGLDPAPGAELAFANPVFTWEAVPGAASYTAEVCRDAACTAPLARTTGNAGTEWRPAALPAGALFWRVIARSADGVDGTPSTAAGLHITAEAVDNEA